MGNLSSININICLWINDILLILILKYKDFAVEIHATNAAELAEDEIMNRVKKAGGADYSGSQH